MKYWIDCKFIENGKTIDLISIGIVAEDGRELYLGNKRCQFEKASPWVKDNVLKPMGFEFLSGDNYMQPIDPLFWLLPAEIADCVVVFMGAEWIETEGQYRGGEYAIPEGSASPEIWGEWCSYDWVAFCQLFGTMMDLPTGFPMRCRDVVQFCEDELNLSTDMWPESLKTEGNHNALMGAKTVKARYEWCQNNIARQIC